MKIVYFLVLVFIFLQQRRSNAAVVRKLPAYATPVYSDSYLPAAMQVIFHAVAQLKNLEIEDATEALLSSTTTTTGEPSTSPHAPGQLQPDPQDLPISSGSVQTNADPALPTESSGSDNVSTASSEIITKSPEVVTRSPEVVTKLPEVVTESGEIVTKSPEVVTQSAEIVTESVGIVTKSPEIVTKLSEIVTESSKVVTKSPEVAIEEVATTSADEIVATDDILKKSQTIYENAEEKVESPVTDETKIEVEAETPEAIYGTPETNHEVQEEVHEMAETNHEMAEIGGDETSSSETHKEESTEESSEESKEKMEGKSSEESKEKIEGKSSEESKEKIEGKSSEESKQEEIESSEEEEEEIRFTLIGEKVAQVPRPSLSSYLRKSATSPLRSTVQELAALYDSLSKDARRQGFAKYSGYSIEVLKTLETSAEGGIGPQLQSLLEKARERNELTRDDAKTKLNATLKKLEDPATALSRELRRILPLRYIP